MMSFDEDVSAVMASFLADVDTLTCDFIFPNLKQTWNTSHLHISRHGESDELHGIPSTSRATIGNSFEVPFSFRDS
ncbi:hypothetical protein Dimus_008047, partial [Dionaea muscipula]